MMDFKLDPVQFTLLTARPAKTSKTLFSTPFFSTSTVSESFLFPKNRKNENGSTMDKNDAMDEIR